jgi:hypothetical protein
MKTKNFMIIEILCYFLCFQGILQPEHPTPAVARRLLKIGPAAMTCKLRSTGTGGEMRWQSKSARASERNTVKAIQMAFENECIRFFNGHSLCLRLRKIQDEPNAHRRKSIPAVAARPRLAWNGSARTARRR